MAGGKHPKPEGKECTDWLYALLLRCWDNDTAKRPLFATLVTRFKAFATEQATMAHNAAAPAVAARNKVETMQARANNHAAANNAYSAFGFGDDNANVADGEETTFGFGEGE